MCQLAIDWNELEYFPVNPLGPNLLGQDKEYVMDSQVYCFDASGLENSLE